MKEQEMLEKELKENFEEDINVIRNHITTLRLIGVGLSNTLNEKDKEIERLKEKTNKLEEEPLTHTMGRIDSVVSNIYRNNKEKDKEIERLKNREQECIDHYLVQCKYASEMEDKYIIANNIINKAIDFLKENACIDEDVEYFCDDLRYDDCKKLLDILRGSDKE